MSYEIYKAEPLTSEMTRVMQDWFDGRDSIFFKVSIGRSEKKRVKPSVKRHFDRIIWECRETLETMSAEMAEEKPEDVEALKALARWATRQNLRIGARAALEKSVDAAIAAGMTGPEINRYVECTTTDRLLPTD